jgi:hypothetical protein
MNSWASRTDLLAACDIDSLGAQQIFWHHAGPSAGQIRRSQDFMKLFRVVAITTIGLLLSLASMADEKLQAAYSDEELVEILKDDGFRAVEIREDRVIDIKVDGQTHVLLIYEDNDLQLYYGLTGYVIPDSAINEWNKTRRLSRAYLDDDNDPILEADLLANAGMTPKQITEWLSVFVGSAQAFRQHLNENDQADEMAEEDESAE